MFMKNPKTNINVTSVTQLNSYTTKYDDFWDFKLRTHGK